MNIEKNMDFKKKKNKEDMQLTIKQMEDTLNGLETLYLKERENKRVYASLNYPKDYICADSNCDNLCDAIDHLGAVISRLKKLYW